MKQVKQFLRRRLALLLACLMVCAMLPVSASAESAVVSSGVGGPEVTWTLTEDGTLTISGTGRMYNYSRWYASQFAPWCSTSVKSLVIEEGVTTIGDYAFAECTGLTSVSLPASLTSFGVEVFYHCTGLTEVTIPANVSSIEWGPFYGCSNLERINVDPQNLYFTTDSNGVLYSTDKTVLVQAPSALSGDYKIPDGVTTLQNYAFSECKLTSLEFPASVTSVGHDVVFGCSNTLDYMIFRGDAPQFNVRYDYHTGDIDSSSFAYITADVYYPANNATWTESVMERSQWRSSGDSTDTLTWIPYSTGEEPWLDSSGEGEETETAPVPEVVDGEFAYCNDTLNKIFGQEDPIELKYGFHYDDSWFLGDSDSYNHELAQMSIRAAFAAFNAGTSQAGGDNAYYIKKLMDQLGFAYDDDSIQYPDPNRYSIGCAIGSKDISEDTTVLMVAVRGAGYESEWSSNVTVGASGDHQGFDEASIQVGDGIAAYINDHRGELKSNIKIWMFGYSRAAAVTNLAAADLNNGFISGISSDDVFAYCFACPQGTTDANAATNAYYNIKSIVNPIDFVPKVAMSDWDFARYGVTFNLPCREGSSDYAAQKEKMMEQYSAFLAYNGLNDTAKRNSAVRSLTAESRGQAVAFSGIADHVAALIGSRKNYANTLLQSDMVTIVDLLVGNGLSDGEIADAALQKALTKIVIKNPVLLADMLDKLDTIRILYPDALSELGHLTNLPVAHYPELYLSWIDALDGWYKNENGKYIKVLVNCPVDVTVYDADQNVVAQIVSDEAVEIENGVVAYVDMDGQKVLVLPCDASYEISLAATDTGTMSYTVEEWIMDAKTSGRVVSYYDVAIEAGDELTGVVPEASENEVAEYVLLGMSGEELVPSEDISGDQVVTCYINVSADGHGTASAAPCKIKGEYIMVYACANEGETFLGWYDGDELVSEAENYRFRVESDTSLTAKFTKLYHISETGTITTEPTCTQTGIQTCICDYCMETYTVDIPATGHTYEDGICITCGAEEISCTLGDVNEDGAIDNIDAMLVMQYTVGIIGDDGLVAQAADVDGSGSADNVDAMLIMQYAVGIITEFPSQQ